MDTLQFAKKLMIDITKETGSKCNLNELNQVEVYITDEDKYDIELSPTWKKYLLQKNLNILNEFAKKQVDFINKVKEDIKNSNPEENLDKLILKLERKNLVKESIIKEEVTEDLVLALCVETREFCKLVDIKKLEKYGVNYLWEKALENSSKKPYNEPLVKTSNEAFAIEMYDNTELDMTYKLVDQKIVNEKFKNKFLAIPEAGQILVFEFNTEDKREQMMALNYLKERVVKVFKNSTEPFSDKIYFYNKESKLEEF